MGCFDYVCDGCNGHDCGHRGGQNRAAHVIIEVILSDGTTVHLKGLYEEYGYVCVKLKGEEHEFYVEQFRQYFKDWLIDHTEEYRSTKLLCNKIYSVSEEEDASERNEKARFGQKIEIEHDCADGLKTVKFTESILQKCIRADSGLGLPRYLDYLISTQHRHKKEIIEISQKIENLKQKYSTAKKHELQQIEREIHEEEHQYNWRDYSIEYNYKKIKEERERLTKLEQPIKRKLRL
jgi:hypothetical protein